MTNYFHFSSIRFLYLDSILDLFSGVVFDHSIWLFFALFNTWLKSSEFDKNVKKIVLNQAKLAAKARLDAIVCSPQEIKIVKKVFKKEIITPGIRLVGDSKGDQKRTMSPKQALRYGATALVMGRSLTNGNIKQNIQKLIKELG